MFEWRTRWVLPVLGGVTLLFLLAFTMTPLRIVTGHFACEANEHLVTETQTVTGTASGSSTVACCAKKTDRRSFGKCNWGDGTWADFRTMFLVPTALALACAIPVTAAALLALRAKFRTRRRVP